MSTIGRHGNPPRQTAGVKKAIASSTWSLSISTALIAGAHGVRVSPSEVNRPPESPSASLAGRAIGDVRHPQLGTVFLSLGGSIQITASMSQRVHIYGGYRTPLVPISCASNRRLAKSYLFFQQWTKTNATSRVRGGGRMLERESECTRCFFPSRIRASCPSQAKNNQKRKQKADILLGVAGLKTTVLR